MHLWYLHCDFLFKYVNFATGRSARIRGRSPSELPVILSLAVQAGFDWVSYEDNNYCRVSVIPDGKNV